MNLQKKLLNIHRVMSEYDAYRRIPAGEGQHEYRYGLIYLQEKLGFELIKYKDDNDLAIFFLIMFLKILFPNNF